MLRNIAEITCLSCARSLGQVEQRGERLHYQPAPDLPTTARMKAKPGRGLICTRCGGHALIGPMQREVVYAA